MIGEAEGENANIQNKLIDCISFCFLVIPMFIICRMMKAKPHSTSLVKGTAMKL
jgi:hypothetical protein